MGFDTKCFEWYGLVDNRNISEDDWYKTEEGINQVLKEFLNIKDIEIVKKLNIEQELKELCLIIKENPKQYIKYKNSVDYILG